MPKEAELYEVAGGSPLEGYFLLKAEGKSMPLSWSERTAESRRARHETVARALREGNWGDIARLRDWGKTYMKECFYYGIRVLFELERKGKTDL